MNIILVISLLNILVLVISINGEKRNTKVKSDCRDNFSMCSEYKSRCNSPEYYEKMKRDCRLTCGFCGGCQDRIDNCKDFLPYCTNNLYKWNMKHYCEKSCNLCGVDVPEPEKEEKPIVPVVCKDKLTDCWQYVPYCKDERYIERVKYNCPKTCGYCEDVCRDKVPYCSQFLEECNNPSQMTTLKHYCPNTCGFCEGKTKCGRSTIMQGILGGNSSVPAKWPWQVTIDFKYNTGKHGHWCGAVIITRRWIVTAAHCFKYDKDPQNYWITAGEYDLSRTEGFEQRRKIDKIILHNQYDSKTYDYDIALIKLKTPIKYNDHVRPICFPKKDLPPGSLCIISGWGDLAEKGERPDLLQEAAVPIVLDSTCQEAFHNSHRVITSRMLCAGFERGGVDTCQGDSGGPLTCETYKRDDPTDRQFVLMGVTSWGVGCGRPRKYGLYADMIALMPWVKTTIRALDFISHLL